jgi:peptidoglycan glycosyltransferase
MRDLKHLSRRKAFSISNFFGFRKKRSANTTKSLKESREKQASLRFILPLIAVTLAAYPVFFVVSSLDTSSMRWTEVQAGKIAHPVRLTLDSEQSFQLAVASMQSARQVGDRLVSPLKGGGTVTYTIDPNIQERVEKVMENYDVPYGVFVAVEPKTGRVLALAGHSTVDPVWALNSYFNVYPMASLFKIITATAALEQNKVVPDTVFAYRGSSHSENPKYWSVKPGSSSQQMSLTLAMGKSINPVFGRLASDVVGKESIMSYVNRFGFNQTLFPGIPVTPSKAEIPKNDDELKLMGAGLGREVKISPLHVVAMIAAIANDGVMMAPVLAQEIRNGAGSVIYSQNPQTVRRLTTPETAAQLGKMMSATVYSGTSRKAFHDRLGRPKLASVNICAKTGSINGKEPEGRYTWFAAFAPAEDPQIALVALIINQDKWKIKASFLGEQAMEAFFDM